ncbi:MAG: hypothetical protein OQL28_03065 [Sedimenticola sp.]|nr:hypothetical protein [Sedimenticola sp.]
MKAPARYLVITSLLLSPMLAAEAYSAPHEGRLHSAPSSQQVAHRVEKRRDAAKISYRDSRPLHHQQRQVRHLTRHFRADGYLSPRERRTLSRQTMRLKHHKKHLRHSDPYRVGPGYWTRDHHRYDRHNHRPYGNSSGTIIFRW